MKAPKKPRSPRVAKARAKRSPGPSVTLQCQFPQATAVFVAGSFNDWHPAATDMLSVGEGKWVKELTLPPGSYEYRLVVDGEWLTDPSCPERVANPFGTENSVLRV